MKIVMATALMLLVGCSETTAAPDDDETTPCTCSAGVEGPTGPQGEPGQDGADGEAGLPGGQGPEGPAGSQGPEGLEGPPGSQGAAGTQGPTGPQGSIGMAGQQGPGGPAGPTGPAGAPGLLDAGDVYTVVWVTNAPVGDTYGVANCNAGDIAIAGGCGIGNSTGVGAVRGCEPITAQLGDAPTGWEGAFKMSSSSIVVRVTVVCIDI